MKAAHTYAAQRSGETLARVSSYTNDPELPSMPYLDDIAVPAAWDSSTGMGVTIAIVDSGIDATHPDLVNNLVAGYDFVDNDADPTDLGCGHGTMVAGIAAAEGDNGQGVVGVAYRARIMPIRVMNNACSGSAQAIAQGIQYAVDQGADIVNVSLNSPYSQVILDAIAYAKARDVLVVAAAGNADTYYDYNSNVPPASEHALVVGGVSTSNTLFGSSSFGPDMVVAPSQSLRTTRLVSSGSYGSFSQTSAASPIIAGVAALVKSAHPEYSRAQICWAIKLSSTDLGIAGQDVTYGWGKVNAAAALTYPLPEFVPDTCAAAVDPPTYGWSHGIHMPGASNTAIRSVAAAGGRIAVVGNFTGRAEFDPSAQTAMRVSDNGGAQMNSFLSVVSNGGRHAFTRMPLGSNADYGAAVAIQPHGGIVTVTSFTQAVNFAGDQGNDTLSAQGQGIAVSLWNADGSYHKSWKLDSSGSDVPYDVAVDAAGNIYVVGIFRNTIDFDPGPGTSNLTASDPAGDAFLAAYDGSGGFRFARKIGSTAQDMANGVAVDATGVYVAGRQGATVDFDPGPAEDLRNGAGGFLAAYALDGTYRWARQFAGYAYPKDVAARPGQDVHVAGYFFQTVDMDDTAATALQTSNGGSHDAFVATFSSAGEYRGSWAFGSPGQDVANGVATDSAGEVHVGGSFSGTVDFDPGAGTAERTSTGAQSPFVARYDASGAYREVWTPSSLLVDNVLSVQVDEHDTLHYSATMGGPVNLATAGPPDFSSAGALYGQIFRETSRPAVSLATATVSRGISGVEIHGGASDADSAVARVDFALDPGADAWQPCDLGGGSAGQFVCTFDLAPDTTIRTVYVRAEDSVGNRTSPSGYGRVPVVSGPIVSLAALDPDPTEDTTPTLTGTASDSDGTVAAVQFQVDGTAGTWATCLADDGLFDGPVESFGCTTPELAAGLHTLHVQATDDDGYVSGPFRIHFTVIADQADTTPPQLQLATPNLGQTANNRPTIGGTAEDAAGIVAAVEFRVDGAGEWAPCSATDGQFDSAWEAFDCTPPALADGAHTLHVRAVDDAGNTTPADGAAATMTVDTTGPALTLQAPAALPYNHDHPTFAGTAEDTTGTVSLVEFQLDGTSGPWIACSAADGAFDGPSESYLCAGSNVADGSHTVTVRATDGLGNLTPPSGYGTGAFAVDTTGPAATLTPLEPDPTTNRTPTLSGTATDAQNVVASVQFTMNDGAQGWAECLASDGQFNAQTESFLCTPSSLPDGTHTLYVRAIDNLGNVRIGGADTFTVDATGPALTLQAPAALPYNHDHPTFAGTAEDSTGTVVLVEFQLDGTSGPWIACSAADGAFDGPSESYLCASSNVADGSHTVTVRATDGLGNLTPPSGYGTGAFTVDTTGPAATLTPLEPDPTTSRTPTLSGTATDAHNLVASVQFTMNNGAQGWTECLASDGQFNAQTESFLCSPSSLPDGTHTLYVRSIDNLGNVRIGGADTFTVDATGPAATLTPLAPDPTTNRTPTLSGTAADAQHVIAAVEFSLSNGAQGWAACSASDGQFNTQTESFLCTPSSLPDGTHTLYVRAVDLLGNVGPVAAATFTVDATVPTLTLTPLTPDPHSNNTPTFSGTASDSGSGVSTVEFRVDTTTGPWSPCVATDGAFDSGVETYSCTTSRLSKGKHTIHVRTTDSAGNVSGLVQDEFTIKK